MLCIEDINSDALFPILHWSSINLPGPLLHVLLLVAIVMSLLSLVAEGRSESVSDTQTRDSLLYCMVHPFELRVLEVIHVTRQFLPYLQIDAYVNRKTRSLQVILSFPLSGGISVIQPNLSIRPSPLSSAGLTPPLGSFARPLFFFPPLPAAGTFNFVALGINQSNRNDGVQSVSHNHIKRWQRNEVSVAEGADVIDAPWGTGGITYCRETW